MSARRSYRHYAYVAWALIGVLAVWTLVHYPGQWWVYALFTLAGNALLYLGFRRDAIFFDAFIGVFFWLGFWLKFSVRTAFLGAVFHDVGHFDGSGAAFDRALLAASCGFAGLLAARILRARLFVYRGAAIEQGAPAGMLAFYRDHRRAIWIGFCVAFVSLALSNAFLGIYQRGLVSRTVLPFGLNGVYSWLLLFGLASVSAVILHCEIKLRGQASYGAAVLGLLEAFCSNVSLLSRGMLFNAGALGYGLFRASQFGGIRAGIRFWAIVFILFMALFAGSVMLVNQLRDPSQDFVDANRETRKLLLDRWVGIEGVMAVSSYPRQSWELWREAWREVPARQLGFYDRTFISSAYVNSDLDKYRFISLPGIIAFFFYPGSFSLLLGCMFALGALAAAIEVSIFKLGRANLILCALLAQVVASRYVHFGFAPRQTYLLFGALYLNLFLIYFADKALAYWHSRSRS